MPSSLKILSLPSLTGLPGLDVTWGKAGDAPSSSEKSVFNVRMDSEVGDME